MQVKFPMSEIAQNVVVMAEIAAVTTFAHSEIARVPLNLERLDYVRGELTPQTFATQEVLCSAAHMSNSGRINPDVPYKFVVMSDGALFRGSYRNQNQSAFVCRDYLLLNGERNALWGDELKGLMQALKDSGIEPCAYETSDDRLEWHETLASYQEALRNAAPARISSLHELQDKFGRRASDKKPRWAA